ncbi:MAG TPA: c-type cytochrome biogenesis protein CcsB [Dehalococcoidia bacterium]|nr:c-type cytochrome biogenesis protein CcsB [Dehalococcoidia bacterium]
MYELSQYAFVAAMAALALAVFLYLVNVLGARSLRSLGLTDGGSISTSPVGPFVDTAGRYGTILVVNAFVFLTASLVFRAIASGHGPFSNMYEFSLAFAWGAIGLYLYFELQYRLRTLALLVLPVALGLLAYATTVPSDITPLVPALQNNLLLTVHVAVAIIAYGAFALAFGAAVLYLVQRRDSIRWLPRKAMLDEIGYRSVMVGFPMMALVIILGALWANIAWGSYWSWDPKETASLVTWLIYGGYLHARVLRGWRGERSALLLIIGFGATLFTYYGNLFFGGLHGYA